MSYVARLKKFCWFFAKLAIAGGIVVYLVLRNPTEILDGFRNFRYAWLLPALAVYLFICWCAPGAGTGSPAFCMYSWADSRRFR
ncbi:MAG: hypothetical protein L6W00_25190 [Lentisphaeria bacterium]|nr:MAG: hypothetical protein L6W00_25190 [Lentisphaeria bacterium]